ncbi:SMEK domain-containing protein [Myxococcus eversor]|uniref:SMEK domain-containing protein n=1 Tax=Myxococcus eversor TaxID=2709661 RepID=UPI0013D7AB53|nr:SMEK domain-containing protein [Myxococcus eversor]
MGQVIDDLDAIASQVRARCALGQTDLNGVLENFFRDVLNLVRGINLTNLNADRSNEPGLDLGDETEKIAFQITSRSDATKINSTLKKITDEQRTKFKTVFVLIIGEKKAKYDLDPDAASALNFTSKNVVDMTDLGREILGLDITTLQSVHRKVANEQARIRIELEPRLPGGGYATTIADFVEPMPTVIRSDATIFFSDETTESLFTSVDDARDRLDEFITKLSFLPRLTRELYGWLIDQTSATLEPGRSARVNYDLVNRKVQLADTEGDLRLLSEMDFIERDEPTEYGRSAHWRILFPVTRRSNFSDAFMPFLFAKRLKAATLMSTMNFEPFGPTPTKALKSGL